MTELEELELMAEQTAIAVNDQRNHPRGGKAWASHCGAGHEYTEQNTRTYKQRGRIRRVCRICDRTAPMTNEVALWMMGHGYATGHGDTLADLLGELVHQVHANALLEAHNAAQAGQHWIDQNYQIDRYGVALMMIREGCADPAGLARRILAEFGSSVPSADYECQDCIGMKEHGCYCKAHGAVAPGGPMPSTPSNTPAD